MCIRDRFRKMAAGDLTRKIFLRQGDFLKNECEKINLMIDGLSDLILRLKKDHAHLIRQLEGILQQVDDPNACQQIGDVLETLRAEADLVSADLTRFRLPMAPADADGDDAPAGP